MSEITAERIARLRRAPWTIEPDETHALPDLAERGLAAQSSEYALVPREPTEAMLKAAWAEAHDENAAGVWREMIAVAVSLPANG